MRIVLCDNPTCGARILGASIVSVNGEDFCSMTCSIAVNGAPDACAHEDNISDQVPGRSKARLICKECGFDRIEEVA